MTAANTEFPPCFAALVLWAGLQIDSRVREDRLRPDEWARILRPLPTREQLVVIYRVLFGLEFQVIADLLDVSRMRVYQLWDRAVLRLRASRVLQEFAAGVQT